MSIAPMMCPAGNTPAYAGKTAGHATDMTDTEKHPRVCGEDSKKN